MQLKRDGEPPVVLAPPLPPGQWRTAAPMPAFRTSTATAATAATSVVSMGEWAVVQQPPFEDRNVLITGGTGSLGHALVPHILALRPRRLIILSRDELKQSEMRLRWPDDAGAVMRYFVGDVRDRQRLRRAFEGVDTVIHAAALKQVPACEYNPREPVLTNILGSQNVIDAALDAGVQRCLLVSTDKACAPLNVYGRTKAIAESLFVQANAGAGRGRFAVVRYGNVMGSRGSVLHAFADQARRGEIRLTDPRMTRFWITLPQAVEFIHEALRAMVGGEVMVPKLPSVSIADVAAVVAPGVPIRITGIRPGEKLHEMLISPDEARQAVDVGDRYVIQPAHPWWTPAVLAGAPMPAGWYYGSDASTLGMSQADLRAAIEGWRHE